jgi:hypothetical protein
MNEVTPATLETFDILRLLNSLPHRYPFLMVDRVIEARGDESGILFGMRWTRLHREQLAADWQVGLPAQQRVLCGDIAFQWSSRFTLSATFSVIAAASKSVGALAFAASTAGLIDWMRRGKCPGSSALSSTQFPSAFTSLRINGAGQQVGSSSGASAYRPRSSASIHCGKEHGV